MLKRDPLVVLTEHRHDPLVVLSASTLPTPSLSCSILPRHHLPVHPSKCSQDPPPSGLSPAPVGLMVCALLRGAAIPCARVYRALTSHFGCEFGCLPWETMSCLRPGQSKGITVSVFKMHEI